MGDDGIKRKTATFVDSFVISFFIGLVLCVDVFETKKTKITISFWSHTALTKVRIKLKTPCLL